MSCSLEQNIAQRTEDAVGVFVGTSVLFSRRDVKGEDGYLKKVVLSVKRDARIKGNPNTTPQQVYEMVQSNTKRVEAWATKTFTKEKWNKFVSVNNNLRDVIEITITPPANLVKGWIDAIAVRNEENARKSQSTVDESSTKYQLAKSELDGLKPIAEQFSKDISEFNVYSKKKKHNPNDESIKDSKFEGKGYVFQLGKPSTILRKVGMPNLPITLGSNWFQNHILDNPQHNLNTLPFKGLVEAIHNPIAIYQDKQYKGQDGRIELLTTIKSKNNKPVNVIIQFNVELGELSINKIMTAFELGDNFRFFKNANEGNLKYVDKERIGSYLKGTLLSSDSLDLESDTREVFSHLKQPTDSSTNKEKALWIIKNFPDILTNVEKKYQQAIAEGNESLLASDEDVQNAVQELQKLLGEDYSIEILKDLIKVKGLENTGAYGSFKRGLITLSKKSSDITKTARHEAFHSVMDFLEQVNPTLYNEVFNAASKRYGIERGESKATVKYSLSQQNEINYAFKSVDLVNKNLTKIKSWESNKAIKEEDLWNKVQQLGVPKEQLSLLKESEGDTVEEKLASFAANYSYTVEINTAKEKYTTKLTQYGDANEEKYQYNGYEYIFDFDLGGNERFRKRKLDSSQFEKVTEEEYLNNSELANINNTQYYANLTVPGGTNYTENEISTPLITPSIKGHAQFSTYNGIGWFRSDEKLANLNELDNIEDIGQGTKTRRILELQSDLFQKGRERGNLTYDANIAEDQLEELGKEVKLPLKEQNQFLQLLNKDNNWVTFFVKSIIQDSSKKGYEKVLFPSGNTASKVEGHTTLEEFKKQKENRIKELEEEKNKIDTQKVIKNHPFIPQLHQELEREENGFRLYSNNTPEQLYTFDKLKEPYNIEINQLKQELERVEKEGFGALKPIYNFYENTVTNILKKQGYNPVLITDEYGNTWSEIEIKPEHLETIKLQAPNIEYSGDLAIEEKLADEFMESKSAIAETWFQKLVQWISNMKDFFLNKGDVIDNLFKDINQGKFANRINNFSKFEDSKLSKVGSYEAYQDYRKQNSFAKEGSKEDVAGFEKYIDNLLHAEGEAMEEYQPNTDTISTTETPSKDLEVVAKEAAQAKPNKDLISKSNECLI